MKVAIIIPVYNVASYLRPCLDSVLSQTYRDWEAICVDDGSTDGCGSVLDEYSKRDSRFCVVHKNNGGLSDARNVGLDIAMRNSKCQYITFIDSDDHVSSRYLEVLYNSIVEFSVEMAVGSFIRGNDKAGELPLVGNKCVALGADDYWSIDSLLSNVAWGKLYRKDMFDGIRFPVGRIGEDSYVSHILCFERCKKIALNTAPLYYYLSRKGSIVRSGWNCHLLDCTRGQVLQVEYFKHRQDIARKSLKCSYRALFGNIVDMLSKYEVPRTERDYLRKILRRYCGEYKQKYGLPMGSYYWVYHILHPVIMNKVTWPFIRGWYLLFCRGSH